MSAINRKNVLLMGKEMMNNILEIKQGVCAIANGRGGNLLIGINPKNYQVEGLLLSEDDFTTFTKDIKNISIVPK